MHLIGGMFLISIFVECHAFTVSFIRKVHNRRRFITFSGNNNIRPLSKEAIPTIEDLKDIYFIPVDEEHPKTEVLAIKHCHDLGLFTEKNTLSQHTIEAFAVAQDFVNRFYHGSSQTCKRVIIDSGCGVGKSTIALAEKNQNIPVIGIDKSFIRLEKGKNYHSKKAINSNREENTYEISRNMLLLRAELCDIWWLMAQQSDWTIVEHYILYPNPYPKAQHLSRRWHGHPIFPIILGLGGRLELRSSWSVYCREFLSATTAVIAEKALPGLESSITGNVETFVADVPLTQFETKYTYAGIPLYRLIINLPIRSDVSRKDMIRNWIV